MSTLAWTRSATCACQLAMGPSWVARPWKMQPSHANMEAAVLELLDLELLGVAGLEAEVEAATGDTSPTVGSSKRGRRGRCGRPRRGGQGDLDGEGGQGRGSPSPRGRGGDGAGELVGDGAVVGVQGTGGEPGDAGAVLGSPGTVTQSIAQRPWMTSRSAFFSEPKGMMGDSPPG